MPAELINEVTKAICDADRDGALRLLDGHCRESGIQATLREVLDPVLEAVGELWNSGSNVSLAQAYVASKVAEDFMTRHLGTGSAGETRSRQGIVVIGNAQDDFHSLGRSMVGIFLRSAGWSTIDLGNDVAARTFVDKAEEQQAAFIAVSAMMYSTALNIRQVREELDRRNLSGRILLLAGGAVFRLRPELLAEVGGDGTAANAIQVAELCRRLRLPHEARVVL